MIRGVLLAMGLALSPACASPAAGGTAPQIVAAERAYADIAAQVAGPDAHVSAILGNPTLDPHDFEPTAATARAVAGARIIIANGLGYDAWMDRLVAGAGGAPEMIIVGGLLHRHDGDNPHLWYDPAAAPALVGALAAALARADPSHQTAYAARAKTALASLADLQARIRALRARVTGRPVAATEPAFGLMQAALGLRDTHTRFELSQMNGTEPRASDVAAIQDDLRAHQVQVLFTNAQAAGPATAQLISLAQSSGVPVVAVGETLPPGQSYQMWIGAALDRTAAALGVSP
jgi:zinc/manganese transport system substrate-binding protein